VGCRLKTIAISQPRYLPACNYIERILLCDVFVMLDNVQNQRRAFEHRNKIRTPDGEKWLSIPINRKGSKSDTIKDLIILQDQEWEKKHFKSFELFYKQTPYYNEVINLLYNFYFSKKRETLNEVVKDMIGVLCRYFSIKPNIVWASNYEWNSKNDDLLIDITKYFGGDAYISGPNGREYIDEKKFYDSNIKLLYHEYNHPIYKQVWGEFYKYMTIWDMMFYYGKNTIDKIKSGKLIKSNYKKIEVMKYE
jgi:hypothetical protein